MRKFISLLMAVVTVVTLFSTDAFAAKKKENKVETVKLTNINDMMNYAGSGDAVYINKATLYNGRNAECSVYVVGLSGTNGSFNPVVLNNIYSCILCFFSIPTYYQIAAEKQMKEQIPEGSKVIIVGHSLGGMVAQQIAASISMKKRYEILDVIMIGSPYLVEILPEGRMTRYADWGDIVPFLSIANFVNFFAYDVSFENTGSFLHFNRAHTTSYSSYDVWKKYDALGYEGGAHTIVFDTLTSM